MGSVEKLVNLLDVISNALDSVSFANKRNYKRCVKHYNLLPWADRWSTIGSRLRTSYEKVVNCH